jgi:hypothetical protein
MDLHKDPEVGSEPPERKRPYPALLSALRTEAEAGSRPARKPPWLKVKAPGALNYLRLKALVKELRTYPNRPF